MRSISFSLDGWEVAAVAARGNLASVAVMVVVKLELVRGERERSAAI